MFGENHYIYYELLLKVDLHFLFFGRVQFHNIGLNFEFCFGNLLCEFLEIGQKLFRQYSNFLSCVFISFRR